MIHFDRFVFDPATGELRSDGQPVRLAPQPAKVLAALLASPGELVTREDLQRQVWTGDTFVDFDQGLNFCLKQLRAALGDAADRPRFVETVPRRGYRFIAPLTRPPAWPRTRPPRPWVTAVAAVIVLAAVGAGIAWTFGPARADARVMLVVLPFDDLGARPGDEYFAAGMTEELTAQLSRVNSERVGIVSRTSALRYRDRSRSAADIGRELNADYIVEGTVRRADGRVRIAARLVQTRDQGHVWADTFERDLRDVLHLQRDVAETIAAEIRAAVSPRVAGRSVRSIDPEAYELYLRGRFLWNRRTPGNVLKAREYFRTAVARDPGFAAAYAGLGDAQMSLAAEPNAFAIALDAATRALALDETLAEAHVTRAHALMHQYDWDKAGVGFRRAIELAPDYAPGRYLYAEYLVARGEVDAAVEQSRRAVQLEPVSAIANHAAGLMLYYARRYEAALVQFAKARELDPQHDWSSVRVAMTYAQLGDHQRAIREIKPADGGWEAYLLAVAGRATDARQAMVSSRGFTALYGRALVLGALGDSAAALAALRNAVAGHHYDTVYLKVDPRLDPLRREPQFAELLRRMGLTP